MLRDYGIDIGKALAAGMSWRRFVVLLSGLSERSRWQLALAAKPAPVLAGSAFDAWVTAHKKGGE